MGPFPGWKGSHAWALLEPFHFFEIDPNVSVNVLYRVTSFAGPCVDPLKWFTREPCLHELASGRDREGGPPLLEADRVGILLRPGREGCAGPGKIVSL